jgi:Zn-dependent protease with chaperone function
MRIASVGRARGLAGWANGAFALLMITVPLVALSQTRIRPGFNLFSPQQDVEIGRRFVIETERQLPLLNDARVNEYVSRIGQTLAAQSQGEHYPYSFKVVNVADINAFALPGGPIYINRGMIEAARTEGELAGMIAHEIAHVVIRHGTNQASRAWLAKVGLGALGGFVGDQSVGEIVSVIGGFGLNPIFLKYSRDAESEADALGAQIMARAGYDPHELAGFIQTLRRRPRSDSGWDSTFFSDHPSPADRIEDLDRVAAQLRWQRPWRRAGNFDQIRSYLVSLSRASSAERVAKLSPAPVEQLRKVNQGMSDRVMEARVEKPSSQSRYYRSPGGFFTVAYPENWSLYPGSDGAGVTFTPRGGMAQINGQAQIVHGAIFNYYRPIGDNSEWTGLVRRSFRYIGGRGEVAEAANDILDCLLQNQPHLDYIRGSDRRGWADGWPAITLTIAGLSPVTGRAERIQAYLRAVDDDRILYALFVAPDDEFDRYRSAFDRMLRSLSIDDEDLRRQ